jgi:hypothetical protein
MDDVKALEAWAQIFTDKEKLKETIAKNLVLNKSPIMVDVEAFKSNYTEGQYFKAG